MTDEPTLTQQITAVEWAKTHIDAKKGKVRTYAMRDTEREVFEAALGAAVETLKTMEFARATIGG
jgi:hypothetical protein